MTYALTKFVSIRSISSTILHREDCRQAAVWLKKCLSQLGAQTHLVRYYRILLKLLFWSVIYPQIPTGEDNNSLVLGTFEGTKSVVHKPRLLFYGYVIFFIYITEYAYPPGITTLLQRQEQVGILIRSSLMVAMATYMVEVPPTTKVP